MNFDESELKEFLLSLMRNKEVVIQEMLLGIDEADVVINGTSNVIGSIETGTEANLRKQVRNTMVSFAKLSKRMKQLLMLNLIMISSDDFTKNIAQLGIKLEGGEVFIREMFKRKMSK